MGGVISKFFIGVVFGIVILLLIAFNALLLWVATGPRSLERMTPYIEAALAPPDGRYSVKIGETWLLWDGWKHPLDIRLHAVTLLTPAGENFSTFPDIDLSVDVLALAGGEVLPTALTISHPVIKLVQNDDRSIRFGAVAAPASAPAHAQSLAEIVAPLWPDEQSGSLRKLHSVTIRDASIILSDGRQDTLLASSNAAFSLQRDIMGRMQAQANAVLHYGAATSTVNAELKWSKAQPDMEGKVEVKNALPDALAGLFGGNPDMRALQLPVNGWANFLLARDGARARLHFIISAGKGVIASPRLDGPLPVAAAHAEGVLSYNGHDNTQELQLDTLAMDFGGGALLSASGGFSLANGDIAAYGHGVIKNVPTDHVHLFWPPNVSKDSREWVTGNITGGMVKQAEVKADIHYGDLAKPVLPKDDISGSVMLEGGNLRYLPDHPPATHVDAVVHVNAVGLEADLKSADFLKETRLRDGKVMIDDLNEDNPYIKVTLAADTTVKDMVRFLGLPRLGQAKKLNLQTENASGTITGSAALGFRFFAPRDAAGNITGAPDLDYDIKAALSNIVHPQFMHKFDIEGAGGDIAINNKQLIFTGKGGVNGAQVESAKVTYLFKPENGFDTFIEVDATTPVAMLPRFGYPQLDFINGTLGVKASVRQGDALEQSDAAFDLAHAALNIDSIKWTKPLDAPATLALTENKKDGVAAITAFHMVSGDTDASGSAQLSRDFSTLTHVEMHKCTYQKTDLDALLYEPLGAGFRLEASGKTIDLTRILAKDPNKDSSFSFEHFAPLHFSGRIGTLIVGKGQELTGLTGSIACDARCEQANLSGKAGGKPFAFRITPTSSGRHLAVSADDAGAFLNALDIFAGIEGGRLTITGDYDGNGLLKGTAEISDHLIKNAPVLAHILSLASLTGFFDTLRGNGIRFSKLIVPFTLQHDIITIEKARTHGPALGLTADGTITFPGGKLDLRGTVVPSYTLNSVLGNVPLIGTALNGGEGQGMFAARYHVTGTQRQPDVSVNPLSILTPGFLRGMFDIFNGSDKRSSESEAE